MKFKSLPIAAIFGCYVFGSTAIAQQVCPVGGGTCVTRPGPAPASSYSNARSVDIMIRQPVPVIPTAQSLAPELLPLLGILPGSVTSQVQGGFRHDGSGYVVSLSYFCVSGRGEQLGSLFFTARGAQGYESETFQACPTGSGALMLGTSLVDTSVGDTSSLR